MYDSCKSLAKQHLLQLNILKSKIIFTVLKLYPRENVSFNFCLEFAVGTVGCIVIIVGGKGSQSKGPSAIWHLIVPLTVALWSLPVCTIHLAMDV